MSFPDSRLHSVAVLGKDGEVRRVQVHMLALENADLSAVLVPADLIGRVRLPPRFRQFVAMSSRFRVSGDRVSGAPDLGYTHLNIRDLDGGFAEHSRFRLLWTRRATRDHETHQAILDDLVASVISSDEHAQVFTDVMFELYQRNPLTPHVGRHMFYVLYGAQG
jgi:hypothetical protein